MKKFKVITIIIFFLILILPMAFINTKADQVSDIDNKKLPEISSIKSVDTFKTYITSRLGFREEMIDLYINANDTIFKEMMHPTYQYGKNGYVFFKTAEETHDDKFLNAFAKKVREIQDYVTANGSYFLFIINPTKISVYRDYLPEGYNFSNYRVESLKKKLDELEVNYIDNTDYLMELAKSEQIFNVKYDAGHWNDLGAFYGINNIYKKMSYDGVDINMLDKEDYAIYETTQKSLPVSKFPIEENVPTFKLKRKNYDETDKFKNSIKIDKAHKYYMESENEDKSKMSLLFFRGSYMNDKEKFIFPQFGDTYLVHNYQNALNYKYYYELFNHPDIVLFETTEYATNNNYYTLLKK